MGDATLIGRRARLPAGADGIATRHHGLGRTAVVGQAAEGGIAVEDVAGGGEASSVPGFRAAASVFVRTRTQ
jgi:hypothetical protein